MSGKLLVDDSEDEDSIEDFDGSEISVQPSGSTSTISGIYMLLIAAQILQRCIMVSK